MTRAAPCAIHWFRRDLRIADNAALYHAAEQAAQVVPVFVLSAWRGEHLWTGPKRQAFLCRCLASLAADLIQAGAGLILRQGDAVTELERLIGETGAVAVYFNRDPDPFGRDTEQQVERMCARLGVRCHGYQDATLHAADQVLKQDGSPYRVFTPYSRTWAALEKPAPVGRPPALSPLPRLASLPLPDNRLWGWQEPTEDLVPAGEAAARRRLTRALEDSLPSYAAKRDLPAAEGTSRLSQDLRFGLLSVRTVYAEAMAARAAAHGTAAREGIDTFVKELAWREFYMAILHHFPGVLAEEFAPEWRGLPWHPPGEDFEAWKRGRTGFPIVDAGIRQLLATGFMHNRLRMIVAMFLTKDLHIDWRLGEQFFMQQLIDGEIASNNGGWQWSAGTGADAAPYFRIQNPWAQAKRHDPEGAYIRRWVPELATVPAAQLFAPPVDGRPLAADYPRPCVDHSRERDLTLAIFKKHKAQRPR